MSTAQIKRYFAGASIAILIGVVAWYAYGLWSAPKKFLTAPSSNVLPLVSWPEIDCAQKNAVDERYLIPRASPFRLALKLRNAPPNANDFFLSFYPAKGSADDKQRWYYGGALLSKKAIKSGVRELEGEANVTTTREQTMRAILKLPDETVLREFIVTVDVDR